MENELILTDDHKYILGSRLIPGVTATLESCFGKRFYWSEWHAGRGAAIHLATHFIEQGELDWSTVDDRIKSRIEAYQKFRAETGFKLLCSELMLFSKRYQFAGTIDRIFEGVILVDIKSSIEPIVDIQLGAYSLLIDEATSHKVKKAAAVELREDGTYKMRWVQDLRRAQRTFLGCLNLANWKNQNNYNYQNKEQYHG